MKLRYLLIPLLALNFMSCEKEPEPEPPIDPVDTTSPINMAFTQVGMPGFLGFKDIVFTANGRAAVLASDNSIHLATDTSYQFAETYTLNHTARCIAMNPNDGRIFVGGISQGYQFGGRFTILDSEGMNQITTGELKTNNTDLPIKYDFNQAYWNAGGGIYLTMGNNNTRRSGAIAIMTNPGTSNRATLYNNSLSPKEFYASGFVMMNNGAEVFVGMTEDIDPLNPTLDNIYTNADKFFGQWFRVSEGYAIGYPYTIGRNPLNNQNVWMFNAQRLYVNGKRQIIHNGLPANNWHSAKVDVQGRVWVCTDQGLYRSNTKLPE